MNKYKNSVVLIFSIVVFVGLAFVFFSLYSKNTQTQNDIQTAPVFSDDIVKHYGEFSDGLPEPDSITNYKLDESGYGASQKQVFYMDINQDNIPDRITKTFYETGNAHSYYEYKIEIKDNGKYVNITPENLKTVNGTNCDLQQIQFGFKPKFHIDMIYREMGEVWNEPTMAYKKTFTLNNGKFVSGQQQKLRQICDVKELF